LQNINDVPAVDDQETIPCQATGVDSRKVREWKPVILGMAIIAASILLGRYFAFVVPFLAFSIVMTLIWRNAAVPWIFLVSIAAAVPVTLFRYQFTCNSIFALWFTILNPRYLYQLPKWIYVPFGLALMGLVTSAINWMSDDFVRGIMRQGTFACNFVLAPIILLPMIYVRMRESRDPVANLRGLLFCLIVPSTLILISAKLFGTVNNAWEASLHVASVAEGFLQYQLGRVVVNFLRTEVGFILAALICASTAVTVSQVRNLYRLVAGACLAANVFLLLVTGSFGSILASLCGLAAIFCVQLRTVNLTKVLGSAAVICCMLGLTFVLLPPSVKQYLGKRYEHRVTNADTDRLTLWGRAVEQLFQHPEGVGWTLEAGTGKKTVIHNDYLAYAVSYGIVGGLVYISFVTGLLISFFYVRKSAINDPAALAIYLAGLGVIVAVAVNSMTDHMTENRWYFTLIWSIVWYSYFCSRTGADRDPSQTWHETGVSTTFKQHNYD
jgi:hypothetical protein